LYNHGAGEVASVACGTTLDNKMRKSLENRAFLKLDKITRIYAM